MTELEELRLAYAECSRQRFELLAKLKNLLQEPKPVAHTLSCVCGAVWDIKTDGSEEMVHTPDPSPPKREWQGLTDEEMHECWDSPLTPLGMKHARMIEAKLEEKNHG